MDGSKMQPVTVNSVQSVNDCPVSELALCTANVRKKMFEGACVCVCQVTHKRAAYRSITNGFSRCQGKKTQWFCVME